MDEVKEVYYEELREKSQLAKSARTASMAQYAKAEHTYTSKEQAALSGPILAYNMRKAMPWKTFSRLPAASQKVYIDTILASYKVGPRALAAMFGISETSVSKSLTALGYRFNRSPKTETKAFLDAYGTAETMPAPLPEVKPTADSLMTQTYTATGAFNASALIARLASLFADGQQVTVTVTAV